MLFLFLLSLSLGSDLGMKMLVGVSAGPAPLASLARVSRSCIEQRLKESGRMWGWQDDTLQV